MTTTTPDGRTGAARFFWAWLITATLASVLGNVTHAIVAAPAASTAIAATAAVVPPTVQLAATHGVHALVQSRIVGATYRAALCITIALAASAFVLSFQALRDLAITSAGVDPAIAWLWPITIDLSITGSTIALLALTGAQRAEQHHDAPASAATPPAQLTHAPVHVEVHHSVHAVAQTVHTDTAERIVAERVVRIDRAKIAEILAAADDGIAPSMIARKVGVGYETVQRVLAAAPEPGQ